MDGCEAHYKLPRTASNKTEWSAFNKERRKLNKMSSENSFTSTCSADDDPTPNQERDTTCQDPESLILSDTDAPLISMEYTHQWTHQWESFLNSSRDVEDQIKDDSDFTAIASVYK